MEQQKQQDSVLGNPGMQESSLVLLSCVLSALLLLLIESHVRH